MTRRTKWAAGGAVAVVAMAAVGVVLLLAGRAQRTGETFERVKMGMTRAEVIEVIGDPPDETESRPGVDFALWYATNGRLAVLFDPQSDTAIVVEIFPSAGPSFLTRLRARFGL